MSSSSTNRAYLLQTAGENSGTWGLDPGLNGNFNLVDKNLGGITTVALTSGTTVLTPTQYANGTIILSGALSGAVLIVFPAIQAWFTVFNQTTGSFTATLASLGATESIAVEQGTIADILINGTQVKFRNLPPVGTYLDVIDSSVPAWITACTIPPYLLCDGSTFSAVTYPYLNAKLGGTTLPDLRGRARYYLDGGTGRITTAGSGIDGATRLSAGGTQGITLTLGQIPAHDHGGQATGTLNFNTHTRGITTNTGSVSVPVGVLSQTGSDQNWFNGTEGYGGTTAPSDPRTIASAGGGGSHNNMPPACIGGITLVRAA